MMNLHTYALVFASITLSHPLDGEDARPQPMSTPIAQSTHAFSFQTPKAIITPTSPAWASELNHRAIASLDTCGYISGDPGYPVTCNLSYKCITWETYKVAGCCGTQSVMTDCVIPTTCVPYTAYESCTGCVKNSLATTCSSSAFPFCSENHYLYGGKIALTEYSCGTTSTTEIVFPIQLLSTITRYASETDSIYTTVITQASADIRTTRYTTTTSTSTTSTSKTLPQAGTELIPTDFDVGAAIGGAIGGFLVLSLLTFWFWSRARKRTQKAAISLSSGSSATQSASMTEKQNVVTTAVTTPSIYIN